MMVEELRYIYDLTQDSWVVDAGAHMGTFAREITRRYDCNVFGFEPVFWKEAIQNQSAKTLIVPVGLGGSSRIERLGVKGDWTGMFCDSGEVSAVNVIDVAFLDSLMHKIDLLKLNIEGMEYEVLERILDTGMQSKIDNLQVQFHTCAPDYFERRKNIQEKLSQTHTIAYDYPFIWESWKRK